MIKKTLFHYYLTIALLVISFSGMAQTKKDACCKKDGKHHEKTAKKEACCEKDSKHKKTAKKGACCSPKSEDESKVLKMGDMDIPNVELVNQFGGKVDLQKLVEGKVVAMNFIFTTCTTICPPMGVNFVKLMELMGDHVDNDLVMISVSIDPTTDTPERLKLWSEKFNPEAGWNLLTGDKQSVDKLLKELNVFTPLIEDHAPIILMGKEGEDNWIRTNGLGKPEELAAKLNQYFSSEKSEVNPSEIKNNSGAENYFTNVKLKNQNGEEMELYNDLLKDKVVIINPFFAECTGTCPVMNSSMEKVQQHLGDRLGKEVVILSITVDPDNDKPETLKEYAKRFNAKEGWYFLSGDKENVQLALKKLGKSVTSRESHDTIFLIGNVSTRLWKKANGLAPADDIIKVLESVIQDAG